ncbi:MAG: putative DNA binding domain-containing protein [Kiritimatiellae bacterium]|nr:putative DNA binding domain-containing protein [Kiritimatiellia bacterium]
MRHEDQNTEYKKCWRDEYLKWICGFANADGGRMVIGVADDRDGNSVVGVQEWKTLLETIPNLMRDALGMIADVNHIRKEGKDLVEVVVPAYPVPISLRGVYYVRRGATNQRLSGPGLEAFLLKRRGLHWENLPCPRLKWKDISAHEIKRFKDLAIEKGRLDVSVRRERKEEFVSNLHLVGNEGLSFAAALLFTEKAEKWIPGAYIKVGKFGENEADLVFHDDVHGSLIQQAEETLSLIYFKYLKAKIWYENGEQRVEKFPFPREALRELILNALVHKDYSSNTPIQISVSDDKIYVANVGSLPETWTIEKLLGKHSSRPFNPTLAGCVYLTGKIETWGRGVRKVFDECKKHGCPPPVYEVSTGDPGDIQVCINAAPDAIVDSDSRGANVETINETINETIKSNPGISMIQLATLLGKSRATIARGISSLVRGKRIEHRGSNKTGGYYAL